MLNLFHAGAVSLLVLLGACSSSTALDESKAVGGVVSVAPQLSGSQQLFVIVPLNGVELDGAPGVSSATITVDGDVPVYRRTTEGRLQRVTLTAVEVGDYVLVWAIGERRSDPPEYVASQIVIDAQASS